MKKKKYLTDLMEENLTETIQQRIDELKRLIDEQHWMTTQSWDLRCKLRRALKHEQERLGRGERRVRAKDRDDFLRNTWLSALSALVLVSCGLWLWPVWALWLSDGLLDACVCALSVCYLCLLVFACVSCR